VSLPHTQKACDRKPVADFYACLDVIKEIPFFILEVGENPLNV